MRIAIRADGGPDIGYGHLVRSGALTEELLSRGHLVTYATTTPEQIRDVCPGSVDIFPLPKRGDHAPFIDWLADSTVGAVFTDAYPVDAAYQEAIRDEVPLAVLQDDARNGICADLFTNGNLYAQDLEYDFVGAEPNAYLGPDYVLLREEIRDLAARSPPWREKATRALITMGGSDTSRLTPTLLHSFDGFDVSVEAIVGPGFSEAQEREIRATADEISADVCVKRDPGDFPERMFEADFAVSTASSTTYELLALGTPVISRPVVDNQAAIASALDKRDAAIVLGRNSGESAFRHAIEAYMTDASMRRSRRELGRNLVDGQGVERVTDAFTALFESTTK